MKCLKAEDYMIPFQVHKSETQNWSDTQLYLDVCKCEAVHNNSFFFRRETLQQ